MRLAIARLALLLLSGCRFVEIRYHGGAEQAALMECHRAEDTPNAIECFEYFEHRGATVLETKGPPIRESDYIPLN